MTHAYEGENGTIHFDGKKCIHSRACVMNLPNMFIANAPGDWIKAEGASTEELMAAAHNCPSGAITFSLKDGTTEENPAVNALYTRENGPLAVRGELNIKEQPKGHRATLCRCGQSANKPYCDGAHVAAGFTASGEPATKPSEALEARNGPLEITPIKDGPLKIAGNLEICSGTGRSTNRVQQTFLCRCGHSKNKPYCDGSHKEAGFQAD